MKYWLDDVEIQISSGKGGKGCASHFRRADHKRVPNGGAGGRGGDVTLRALSTLGTLGAFRPDQRFVAESGAPGSSNKKRGHDGEGLIVEVPCGTLVVNEHHELRVRDLASAGDEVCVARGGRGGWGNADGRTAQPGLPGETFHLRLDLRIPADVALVGTPNSGKSTLLNALTGAHSRVGDYAFTTRELQLGSYETADYRRLALMELPGLLQGSFEGRGIGNKFLKHLSRVRLIVFVLDPENPFGYDLQTCYDVLLEEVRRFEPRSLELAQLAVVSKADRLTAALRWRRKREHPIEVSALEGTGMAQLRHAIDSGSGPGLARGPQPQYSPGVPQAPGGWPSGARSLDEKAGRS